MQKSSLEDRPISLLIMAMRPEIQKFYIRRRRKIAIVAVFFVIAIAWIVLFILSGCISVMGIR
jgi:small neutral amino acid transporter SnatA (MarC family)